MRCEQVMKRDVEFVTGGDTVQTAAKKMRSANVGFLPVCDASTKKVIGTITDRDLAIRILADAKAASTAISDVMTRDVVSCRPADDLTRAHELMSSRKKSRMIVTDEREILVGVISLSDVAKHDVGRAAETLKQVAGRETRAA
jgi:CBS domain-containing protein